MEEQIKKTAARVRTTFAYFWMLPILLVLLGETGGGWVGMYAGDVRVTYMAETVTILLGTVKFVTSQVWESFSIAYITSRSSGSIARRRTLSLQK